MKFKELLEHSLPHSMNYGNLKALRIKPLIVLGFVNEIGLTRYTVAYNFSSNVGPNQKNQI